MRKTLILLFCLTLSVSHAQDIKTYVKQHTTPVRTVSPLDTSFDDLEALGAAIGDARIVMLGEQDHGDAPTFLAKTRIIKYLHEKKGFNVLAFESDFYALNQGLDLVGNKAAADSFTRRNIFPIWTSCDACAHLFYEYLPATRSSAQPLRLSGFDNQMILSESRRILVPRLDSLLRALDLPITKRDDYGTAILPALKAIPDFYGMVPGNLDKTREYLAEIHRQALTRLAPNDPWMMVVNNLVAETDEFFYFMGNIKDKQKGSTIRDKQMSDNLRWLAIEKYPGEKIIVWAANAHIAKYGVNVAGDENSRNAMGFYFTQDEEWRKQTYVLGFSSRKGEAGRLGQKPYKLRKPNPQGFESWIDDGTQQAFVDFSLFRKQNPDAKPSFILKSLGHSTNFTYDWTSVFDGIFYIRDMYPCKSLSH